MMGDHGEKKRLLAAAVAAARCDAKVRCSMSGDVSAGCGLLSRILDAGNKRGIVQEIAERLRQRAGRWHSSFSFVGEIESAAKNSLRAEVEYIFCTLL